MVKVFCDILVYGLRYSFFKGISYGVCEVDKVMVYDYIFIVFVILGYIFDYVCYINDELSFIGDILFSVGCGWLFEGSVE